MRSLSHRSCLNIQGQLRAVSVKVSGFSPKGWQMVAGGRSLAQTSGVASQREGTPAGCQIAPCPSSASPVSAVWHPFGMRPALAPVPGGLHCIATPGYRLETLRVSETVSLSRQALRMTRRSSTLTETHPPTRFGTHQDFP